MTGLIPCRLIPSTQLPPCPQLPRTNMIKEHTPVAPANTRWAWSAARARVDLSASTGSTLGSLQHHRHTNLVISCSRKQLMCVDHGWERSSTGYTRARSLSASCTSNNFITHEGRQGRNHLFLLHFHTASPSHNRTTLSSKSNHEEGSQRSGGGVMPQCAHNVNGAKERTERVPSPAHHTLQPLLLGCFNKRGGENTHTPPRTHSPPL